MVVRNGLLLETGISNKFYSYRNENYLRSLQERISPSGLS